MAEAGKITVHVVVDEHHVTTTVHECDRCAALVPIDKRAKHEQVCMPTGDPMARAIDKLSERLTAELDRLRHTDSKLKYKAGDLYVAVETDRKRAQHRKA